MRHRIAISASAVAIALAMALSACGDDDESDTADTQPSTQPAATTSGPASEEDQAPVERGNALEGVIYPRCGVEGYGSPAVGAVPQFGGFQLVYTHVDAEGAAPPKGKPLRFSIEERPRDSTRVRYKDGTVVRIRGTKVDLVDVERGFTAQWVSDRARYVVVGGPVNGGLVEKLVRCLP